MNKAHKFFILLVQKNNQLQTFEIKWNPTKNMQLTKSFSNIYGEVNFAAIHRENYFEVIENFK